MEHEDHPHRAGEEDGVLFLVMRYVSGSDLRSLIQRNAAVEPERAVAIASQVALTYTASITVAFAAQSLVALIPFALLSAFLLILGRAFE